MPDPIHPPPDPASGPAPTAGQPAGWYPDPDGHGLRWWDGTQWTAEERDPPGMRCLVCGHGDFDRAQYMLNTQGMTLLGWDGFNRQASCFVCRYCGFIHWFAPSPPAP